MFQSNPGTEIFIKPLDFVMLPLDAQYSLHPFGESEHAGLKSLHNHTCLWVEVESSRGCQGAAGEEVGSVSYPGLVAGRNVCGEGGGGETRCLAFDCPNLKVGQSYSELVFWGKKDEETEDSHFPNFRRV